MKEDDSGLLLALRDRAAREGGRERGPTPPPFFGNQKSVKAPPGNAAHFFIPVAMRRRGRTLWARPQV